MNWRNAPIGIMRHDELLNALLAIWKAQQGTANRNSEYAQGFKEGLEAIAQMAGLAEEFEAGKVEQRRRIGARCAPPVLIEA